MASKFLFGLLLCVLLVNVLGDNFEVGTTLNSELVHVERVQLSSIPLKTRIKNVFFNYDGSTPKTIKGITAIDLEKSKGKVSITAGGVGSTFANIRLKSERGDGLNYQIQIFA